MSDSDYLTKEIAADLLGLSPRRVLELADEGKIGKHESYNPQTKRRQTVLLGKDVKRLAADRQPGAGLVPTSAAPPQPAASPRPWLRIAELAAEWGVSEGAVYELIRSGDLPARRFACRDPWRIHRADLEGLRGERQVQAHGVGD